jgi:hypothetical protein
MKGEAKDSEGSVINCFSGLVRVTLGGTTLEPDGISLGAAAAGAIGFAGIITGLTGALIPSTIGLTLRAREAAGLFGSVLGGGIIGVWGVYLSFSDLLLAIGVKNYFADIIIHPFNET